MRPAPSLAFAAPKSPQLGEVLEFLRLIWALDHALQKASKRMQADLGVTGPQRFVLRMVRKFPGIPAGQIAGLLHVHPSTLTGIVKRLEQQGLVRRRPDLRDARRSCLGITEKGRQIDTSGGPTIEAAVERAISLLPRSTLDSARTVLQTVTVALAPGRSAASARGLTP